MKCCANCEWSISPLDEENIMEEQNYKENDPDKPNAGDCIWGHDHGKNFVCKNHTYLKNGIETSIFYDDKYLGPGFLIVVKFYDEIIKFLKIYRVNTSEKYKYIIRGYDVEPYISDKQKIIEFEIKNFREYKNVFENFYYFARTIDEEVITSSNPKDKSSLVTEYTNISIYLTLIKYIKDTSSLDNNINININSDNYGNYSLFERLFYNLSTIGFSPADEDTIKKIKNIKKER